MSFIAIDFVCFSANELRALASRSKALCTVCCPQILSLTAIEHNPRTLDITLLLISGLQSDK